jgi:hypothetical protein
MMDTDLEILWLSTSDEPVPQLDGSIRRDRKYVFRLGKFGPFTERVPLEPFDDQEIGRRVQSLRSHLRITQQL